SGAKMMIFADGSTRGSVGGGIFEMLVVRDAQRAIAAGGGGARGGSLYSKGGGARGVGGGWGGRGGGVYEGGTARGGGVLVGGGHCGRALARAASLLDFEIVVADDREEFARAEDFALPNVSQVIKASATYAELPPVDPQTYVVLVSKGFITDEAALRRVIASG